MDHQPHQPNASHRASGLPRPISRLPVPRSGLRHTPSVDNLSQRPALSHSISNPRLRAVPSRDQLSVSSTSSKPRVPSTPSKSREISSGSTGTVIHKTPPKQPFLRRSSSNALFKRSQQSAGAQQTHARPPSRDSSAVIQEDIQEGAELVDKENIAIHGRRKPRLSLSERTMETLQSIPSSPAVQRKSSFFNTENSPMRPPSRASSSSRPSSSHTDKSMRPPYRSVSSRPTSSSGSGLAESIAPDFRASTNTFSPPESTTLQSTPMKRPGTVKSLKTPSSIRSLRAPGSAASKLPSPTSESFFQERSPSPVKTAVKVPTLKSGSKSFSSRQVKPRGSVNGLFREQPMIDSDQPAEIDRIGFGGSNRLPSSFSASSEDTAISSLSPTSSRTNNTSESDDQTVVPRKTSLTLREQIAQAKAAKRAALKNAPSAVSDPQQDMPVMPSGTFDFGLSQDPFNQQIDPNSSKGLLRKRIDSARTDGRLNIAAMGFKEMPEEVLNMYNLEAVSGSWAECVDLTRFIAADNEFEELSVEVFPDVDPRAAVDDDDDGKGNQFGGLETIDLHGNLLKAIPLGFRRLELLTTLNLSNNKLSNDCFEVISQISALRDLKVAGNSLSGALPEGISQLHNLEVLDIQRNTLTSLPKGLADLVKLRVLNLAENQFASLPFDSLCNLPLVELVARKNRLSGTLIEADVKALPHLQILDVTGNSLTNLAISELALPALHQLSCSCNRLTGLPDMSSWDSLLTIAAEDNNISSLPEGFVNLSKVKNVDFSGNDLKMLDDKIGGMESLVIFRISGNPLREKKFAGMATDDLKRALKARMAPVEPEIQDEESIDGEFLSAQSTPSRPSSASDWPVQTGGILDRSNTKSTSLNPVASAQVASNHSIKVLQLHHNNFQEIPASIAFFAATLTTLNLSHNEFTSDTFLKDELELPALKELDLSANTFSSLQPLMQRLIAPQLERLDISFNRLTSLPVLRTHFPNLTTVLASNNTIRELSPEAVKGLRVLDCNSNDLSSLNARLGLLGGPGGLQRLDVRGNRFRVPKYTVLDKGTEATLAWLRDRIPAGETSMNDVD